MKGAGPHFHVIGLVNDAPLIGPELMEGKNKVLEIHGDTAWLEKKQLLTLRNNCQASKNAFPLSRNCPLNPIAGDFGIQSFTDQHPARDASCHGQENPIHCILFDPPRYPIRYYLQILPRRLRRHSLIISPDLVMVYDTVLGRPLAI